jgi:DNA-binding GntR family transcriptional regulator
MSLKSHLASSISITTYQNSALSYKITQDLTKSILAGKIKPGQRLLESELQQVFETSRTPIREALRELGKLGLVDIRPRRGTFVRKITKQHISQIIPVRAILEGLAARQAYQNINSTELKGIRRALNLMKKYAKNGINKQYRQQHVLLHEIIVSGSQNQVLIDMLKPLRTASFWYRFSIGDRKEDLWESFIEHENLFNTFFQKEINGKKIEQLFRYHVEKNLNKFLCHLEELGK